MKNGKQPPNVKFHDDLNIRELGDLLEKKGSDKFMKGVMLGDGKNTDEGSLIVRAVITDINTVSGFSKFMWGIFAGEALIALDVSFIDAKTGNSIGEYNSTYEGGTTSTAMEVAVDRIIEVINENYN